MYCETIFSVEKNMETTDTNGYESAETATAPRKVRGTTPGNSVWSYYVEGCIHVNSTVSLKIASGLRQRVVRGWGGLTSSMLVP